MARSIMQSVQTQPVAVSCFLVVVCVLLVRVARWSVLSLVIGFAVAVLM